MINKTIELDYEYGVVTIFLDKLLSISVNNYSEGEGGVVTFNMPYISHSKPFGNIDDAKEFYSKVLKEIK